jgi:pSer/pThr/pTyr-binding forkhead associated (FHA) protein
LLGPARPIKGRLHLTAGELGYTMRAENVLIGRAGHCRVVIDDPLVSREHALLSVSPIAASIEDLDSANGTWVNDSRISGPQLLGDGDRIRVGAQELRVSSVSASDSTPPESSTTARTAPGSHLARDAPTERADALSVLARVAARKLTEGDPLGAEAALRDQLAKVLVAASVGLAVSPSVCGAASKQALLLALALGDPQWVDYVVKLHLRARLIVAPQVGTLLEEGLTMIHGVDTALLEEYLEMLGHSELPAEERRLLERLRELKLWAP